jgi:hypothetical protein
MYGVSHDDLMRLHTDHGSANIASSARAIKDEASLKIRGKTD